MTTHSTYKHTNIQTYKHTNIQTYTYEYDGLGQLVEECSRPEQKCTAYAYDLNGNITTKTEYPVDITIKEYIFKNVNPSRTYTYSYNNDLWKDELTSYTRVIHDSSGDRTYTTPANTYDAIGNPKKYFGSDLEWDYGRRLRRFYSGLYDTTYSYNADGMLIKQDVTYNTIPDYPINYSYENYYDGTMLIRRTSSGVDAWFDYDESGSPVGMNVTTTTGSSSNPTVTTAQYYFVKNLQGDIVAIADATGEIKYTYTYDSWGKVLSTNGQGNSSPSVLDTSSPANINPFRYRGYYYDGINEIYWLQSRFYDPSTGRFLNADGYVTTGQGLLSTNMFLYCGNNPVNRLDSNGAFFRKIGQFLSNAWNEFKNWVVNTFGASESAVHQIKQETELMPKVVNTVITVKTGTKENKTISKRGDSSKPVSVYAKERTDNVAMSSVGININIKKFNINISLGLDNIGISTSINNGEITDTFGLSANISQAKVGFEASSTVKWDESTTVTNYTNASITGWGIAAMYIFMQTGQWISSPQQPAY